MCVCGEIELKNNHYLYHYEDDHISIFHKKTKCFISNVYSIP